MNDGLRDVYKSMTCRLVSEADPRLFVLGRHSVQSGAHMFRRKGFKLESKTCDGPLQVEVPCRKVLFFHTRKKEHESLYKSSTQV